LSGGYNGFPRGVADNDRLLNRDTKLKIIVHAEANAVAAAGRNGHSLKGAVAYITSNPCAQCAALLIQAGIVRVVYIKVDRPRWVDENKLALEILKEARVEYEELV
jgi:dCMP deaminase